MTDDEYKKQRVKFHIEGLEKEYMNLMSAYFRMTSYKKKIESVELSDDEAERVNAVLSKMKSHSKKIYKTFHPEK